jgi:hypothetical protein
VNQAQSDSSTGGAGTDQTADKSKSSTGDHTGGSSKDTGAKQNEHTEKMYCN